MKPIHTPWQLIAALALSAPVLAQTNDRESAQDDQNPADVRSPVDAKGEFESIHDYLMARYDVDRDGRITAAEYARSEETFKRLDKNQDGVLTTDDFASRSRGGSGGNRGVGQMSSQMAMRFVAWYFQGDDEPGKLLLAELEAALETYDTDEDGAISKDELSCGIPLRSGLGQKPSGRMAQMLEGEDAYKSLLAAADKDKNGALARVELVAFFKAQDSNSDGVWDLSGFSGSPRGGARGGGRGSRPVTGPEQGTLAPDFTLTTLQGDEQVSLSEFRGKKPVALIFGSYT